MITLNILAFLAMLVGTLGFGVWVAVRIYRECNAQDEHVRRFLRDVDVCDEAEDGWTR